MKKDNILKFYNKYKLFVFPTVVALSSLILIAFVILPQTLKLISNQKTSSDLLSKTQTLEVKAQTLEALNEDELSTKVVQALNVYPSDKDFGNALGIIQTITGRLGFNIASLEVGGSAKGGQSYSISVQLTGPKVLISTLLNDFESAPRLMNVESIELSQAAGIQGVEVNLTLSVLFSPLPQNFGTVDSPLPRLSEKEEELLVKLARAQEESGIIISSDAEAVPSSPRGKANPFE